MLAHKKLAFRQTKKTNHSVPIFALHNAMCRNSFEMDLKLPLILFFLSRKLFCCCYCDPAGWWPVLICWLPFCHLPAPAQPGISNKTKRKKKFRPAGAAAPSRSGAPALVIPAMALKILSLLYGWGLPVISAIPIKLKQCFGV